MYEAFFELAEYYKKYGGQGLHFFVSLTVLLWIDVKLK